MASVPAWKRLGLKLKGSSDSTPTPTPASAPASAPKPSYSSPSSFPAKRKFDSATGSNSTPLHARSQDPASSSSFKKPRFDSAPDSRRKSVSFSAETSAAPAPVKAPKKPKTKKPKATAGAAVATKTTDITPSLEYLRLWKSARAAWKFNKNHQTLLIKYVYDNALVPARDVAIFYDYIRDIQGYARVRLVEAARAVQKADMEHVTGVAPPAGPVVAPTAQQMASNAKYHVRLAEVLRDFTSAASKRVDEAALAATGDDAAMLKRVVKRMRAEAIIAELADGESSAPVAKPVIVEEKEEKVEKVEKPVAAVKANGKKVRSRKKRIMADSDSSSSESDSDSDSDEEPKKSKAPAKKAAKKAESVSSESSSESDSDSD